jgi:RNA polymerase subunit RPABC4/transcription elongation factor Spt4
MQNKRNDTCTKCASLLNNEGFCERCLNREYSKQKGKVHLIETGGINCQASAIGYKLEIGKLNRIGKVLGYPVYNDMRGKLNK